MNFRTIISSPILPALFFSFILISGESFGGFYITYVLFGIPSLQLHSLLGGGGLLCLAIGQFFPSSANWRNVFHGIGVVSLITSLLVFFGQDPEHYNDATFTQTLPLLSLILFGLVALIFLINLIRSVRR